MQEPVNSCCYAIIAAILTTCFYFLRAEFLR